jgi:hypothetical protein
MCRSGLYSPGGDFYFDELYTEPMRPRHVVARRRHDHAGV